MTAPTGEPARASQPVVRQLLGALIAYCFLAYALTASVWSAPNDRWIGGCCDQEQSMWFLAWMPTALETGQNPLVTDRLNAPDGANLMWNTSIPALAFIAAPVVRAAGPILAYNLLLFAAIVVSGLACFVALRRFTERPLGPLIGGGLYAISPYMASHAILHLVLVVAWAPPVVLILVDELVARRTHRPEVLGGAIGLVGAIQLLIAEEALAMVAVAGAVLLLVLALVVRSRRSLEAAARRVGRAIPAAVAVFLLIGGLPLAVQFLGPQQLHGQVQDTSTFSTDLLNLVIPTSYQLLAPAAATAVSKGFSGLFHEATGYVGLPLLAVLAWIVIRGRGDARVIVAAATGLAMFILSLGPVLHVTGASTGLPMPWAPIGSLPLLEHLLPGRLTLYMWLAVAALVALGIDRFAAASGSAAAIPIGLVAGALVFVVPAPLPSSTAQIPPFFRSWVTQGIGSSDIVLMAPWFADGAGADPMLWAAVAQARPRMYEGYIYVPDAHGRPHYGPVEGQLSSLMTAVQDKGVSLVARGPVRDAALRELATKQIADVIVGPMRYRDQMIAFFTDLLGVPPTETGGVELWRDVPGLLAQQGVSS